MVTRESGGYKFRFLPMRIVTCSGHTIMIPRTTTGLRSGFALFAAGGPVVTALLFIPVALLPWGMTASCLLAANIVLALFSWIPMTLAGTHTDGRLLRTLAGKGPASERLAAILYVTAIDNCGARPREWPREIVDCLAAAASEAGNPVFRAEAAVLQLVHALDVGEIGAIAGALERLLSQDRHLRPALRRVCFSEAAFFQGVYRRQPVPAGEWLEDARKVKGAVAEKDWDSFAMGAVAFARQDWEEARRQFARAIAYLDRRAGNRGSLLAARGRVVALMESMPAPGQAIAATATPNPGT